MNIKRPETIAKWLKIEQDAQDGAHFQCIKYIWKDDRIKHFDTDRNQFEKIRAKYYWQDPQGIWHYTGYRCGTRRIIKNIKNRYNTMKTILMLAEDMRELQ
jgi:hypothetical protein